MDTGAQNAVVGDDSPVNIPVTVVKDEDLAEEKNRAKFTTTKEFQWLKEYMENRIKFFQSYLPDGTEVRFKQSGMTVEQLMVDWKVATNVIKEFEVILEHYRSAKEAVDARLENS